VLAQTGDQVVGERLLDASAGTGRRGTVGVAPLAVSEDRIEAGMELLQFRRGDGDEPLSAGPVGGLFGLVEEIDHARGPCLVGKRLFDTDQLAQVVGVAEAVAAGVTVVG
jgi:hypothetical protein